MCGKYIRLKLLAWRQMLRLPLYLMLAVGVDVDVVMLAGFRFTLQIARCWDLKVFPLGQKVSYKETSLKAVSMMGVANGFHIIWII